LVAIDRRRPACTGGCGSSRTPWLLDPRGGAGANFSALSVEAGVAEVSLEEYDPVAVLLAD